MKNAAETHIIENLDRLGYTLTAREMNVTVGMAVRSGGSPTRMLNAAIRNADIICSSMTRIHI
jgi:hypothetical protein